MTEHERWADSTASYLLGALEDDERSGFEAHLENCEQCREEVAFLRVAADALPVAVEQHAAPPALKGRIMNVVNSEAELLRAAGPEADRPPVPRRSDRRWWQVVPRSGLALAASVLLIVGGVTGWVLRDGGSAATQTIRAVTPPDVRASLVVRGDHSTLEAEGLPRPGTGRVYQVWLMREGAKDPEPTDALFTVSRDGTASVDVPGDIEDVAAVLVTEEPDGGSPAPTSEPIIAASLA